MTGFSIRGSFTYRLFSIYAVVELAFRRGGWSPFIGHAHASSHSPRSLIDFHGLDDWTVPRQFDHPGEGPMGEVEERFPRGTACTTTTSLSTWTSTADTSVRPDWVSI